jgi:hypothetical protein
MKNEGAIGLTHRSCFRVAAVPTLATRGATICRIILDDLLFLKARRQGRREDVKWHQQADKSHRRAAIISAGRQNPSPHHNLFSGPANPIAACNHFRGPANPIAGPQFFQWASKNPSPRHHLFIRLANPIATPHYF